MYTGTTTSWKCEVVQRFVWKAKHFSERFSWNKKLSTAFMNHQSRSDNIIHAAIWKWSRRKIRLTLPLHKSPPWEWGKHSENEKWEIHDSSWLTTVQSRVNGSHDFPITSSHETKINFNSKIMLLLYSKWFVLCKTRFIKLMKFVTENSIYADWTWLVGSCYWKLTWNYNVEPITDSKVEEESIELSPLEGK